MNHALSQFPDKDIETVLSLEDFHALSAHRPLWIGAVTGWGHEFPTQKLYDAFCSLFILRHTFVGSQFGLYLKVPRHNLAEAIHELLQFLLQELLHQFLRLVEVEEYGRHTPGQEGIPVFHDFLWQCRDVKNIYLRPLVKFMWDHRMKVLNSAQVAAHFASRWEPRHEIDWALDLARCRFGLIECAWISQHTELICAIAAHTRGGSKYALDEAYRGVREAITAGSAFRRGYLEAFDSLADSLRDLFQVIVYENGYRKWEEWWHNQDIITVFSQPLNPFRLDTANYLWKNMAGFEGVR